MRSRALAHLCLVASLCGCAGARFERGVFNNGEFTFRTVPLGPDWRVASLSGSGVVFQNERGGAILASGLCDEVKDVPLDVLENHALFGITDKAELGRTLLTLEGRSALRVHLTASLDGVPVELDLVAVKKDGCTYDLQLASGADVFASRDAEFMDFVRGFSILTRALDR